MASPSTTFCDANTCTTGKCCVPLTCALDGFDASNCSPGSSLAGDAACSSGTCTAGTCCTVNQKCSDTGVADAVCLVS